MEPSFDFVSIDSCFDKWLNTELEKQDIAPIDDVLIGQSKANAESLLQNLSYLQDFSGQSLEELKPKILALLQGEAGNCSKMLSGLVDLLLLFRTNNHLLVIDNNYSYDLCENIDASEALPEPNDLMSTLTSIWFGLLQCDIASNSTNEIGLLFWCQRKANKYDGVSVENFTESWKDGRALAALMDSLTNSTTVNYDELADVPDEERIQAVLHALSDLGIPAIMEVENFVQPVAKSVATYLSLIWGKYNADDLQANAANRIKQFVTISMKVDQMVKQYQSEYAEIAGWLEEKTEFFQQLPDLKNNSQAGECLNQHKEYLRTVKPQLQGRFLDLEEQDAEFRAVCQQSGRAYNDDGMVVEDLRKMWEELEKGEHNYLTHIQDSKAGFLHKLDMDTLSADRIKEFQQCFVAFDKDNSNTLDKEEFRAACQGVGVSLTDSAFEDTWKEYCETGTKGIYVSKERYLQFCKDFFSKSDDAASVMQSFAQVSMDANDREAFTGMSDEEYEYLMQKSSENDGDLAAFVRSAFQS